MFVTLAQNSTPLFQSAPAFLALLLFILIFVGIWKMFEKANQPGWAIIIPIYNIYILCKIVGRPWWWVVLMWIPLVNVVLAIILMVDLAKSFSHGIGFAVGLVLLPSIFMCILGFDHSEYQGPSASGNTTL